MVKALLHWQREFINLDGPPAADLKSIRGIFTHKKPGETKRRRVFRK